MRDITDILNDFANFTFWWVSEIFIALWEAFCDWFEETTGPQMVTGCLVVWLMAGLYILGLPFLIYVLTSCLIVGPFVYSINKLEK